MAFIVDATQTFQVNIQAEGQAAFWNLYVIRQRDSLRVDIFTSGTFTGNTSITAVPGDVLQFFASVTNVQSGNPDDFMVAMYDSASAPTTGTPFDIDDVSLLLRWQVTQNVTVSPSIDIELDTDNTGVLAQYVTPATPQNLTIVAGHQSP